MIIYIRAAQFLWKDTITSKFIMRRQLNPAELSDHHRE